LVFPVSLLFLRSPTVARTDLVRFFSSAPIVSRVARLCNMGVRFGLRFWLSVYASSLLLWVWTVVSRESGHLNQERRSREQERAKAPSFSAPGYALRSLFGSAVIGFLLSPVFHELNAPGRFSRA
jgi:hypothetical protein